ncbi:MAG: ATP-dependent Clp protease ATP-binding subunit, partial [Kiritimatiellae bacterium]|nr:ATP-dependent Clp protease ATP-binding subunit [Kiritimatiellia bacterium]
MNPFEQFSTETQKALQIANREAHGAGAAAIGAAHILTGLACMPPGDFRSIAEKIGLDGKRVRFALEKYVSLDGANVATIGPLPFTPRVRKILQLAIAEAREARCRLVMPEHLLLAILREGTNVAAKALADLEIDYDKVSGAVKEAMDEAQGDADDDDGDPPPPPGAPPPMGFLGAISGLGPVKDEGDGSGGSGAPGEAPPKGDGSPSGGSPAGEKDAKPKPHHIRRDTPALDTFGRDLVKEARAGKLDPMIGRTRELERLVQILCRRGKNNAALIGEAGVGKTAVVEGLAKAIADGAVPEPMLRRRIVSLDLTLMVAGTKFRGQFEERIKHVIEETRKSDGEIILFIDEI